MIQAIRIEWKDGNGIFRNTAYNGDSIVSFSNPATAQLLDRHKAFPTPKNDKGINRYIHSYEYCAFKSIDELQQWITSNEIKYLLQHEFNILLLDLSEAIIGEYQILYDKRKILNQKNINQLFV